MAVDGMHLVKKKCKPLRGDVPPLSPQEIGQMLAQLSDWEFRDGVITKTFSFSNYGQTIAFVNATAWISHREDHHPEITLGYNRCRLDYSTHSINGISENDFICAAKVDALFAI